MAAAVIAAWLAAGDVNAELLIKGVADASLPPLPHELRALRCDCQMCVRRD